ncbi:VOC family protein [Phenylobacterium montanum]|uniref:VOC family protein n=1 Tax=Phenylobacterium montanum TaxID=2823693 RepID=A0A975G2E7_9CAUL|nr:VOC family protein [Caulobacter sp. S6]QUD89451.1 VOC family protein [Caulobacter sp. S6]
MLAYSTLGVNHMAQAVVFYDAVFAPLGVTRDTTSKTWTGYSRAGEKARFFLTRPFDGGEATTGNGVMLAFLAPDRAAVDAFHAAALEHGGRDEGPPGVREGMDPVFYAAYVRDLDGHKLCAFVRK